MLTVSVLGVWGLLFFFRLGGATGTGTEISTVPFILLELLVLAMTSGSCNGTLVDEEWAWSLFSLFPLGDVFTVASSLSVLEDFCIHAAAESVDKLWELCEVKDEVSGKESSSFPTEEEGNTAGCTTWLSRPMVPAEKEKDFNKTLISMTSRKNHKNKFSGTYSK